MCWWWILCFPSEAWCWTKDCLLWVNYWTCANAVGPHIISEDTSAWEANSKTSQRGGFISSFYLRFGFGENWSANIVAEYDFKVKRSCYNSAAHRRLYFFKKQAKNARDTQHSIVCLHGNVLGSVDILDRMYTVCSHPEIGCFWLHTMHPRYILSASHSGCVYWLVHAA